MKDYSMLQNGSDIRGVALSVENGRPVDLTLEAAKDIGAAFGLWLSGKAPSASRLRVAIGRDSRVTGAALISALCEGLSLSGVDSFDCGMASSPAMFMCCVSGDTPYDGGIMTTASHLPMERNGFKFFTKNGGLEKEDIRQILSLAANYSADRSTGKVGTADVMTDYIQGLRERILSALDLPHDARPFEGMNIIVDAGNGAGGFFATRLLAPLGADITGSLYLEPDGTFPHHQPNPENMEAMSCITKAVIDNKSDMGIIFDTDVDRAGAVLPYGDSAIALDRNRLIAIMTAILSKQYGGITVVTDSITSVGLNEFIKGLGCRHHRFKRGYRNVINEARRLVSQGENAIFAMETSGHGALYENYFLDDGAYIIVKLLIELVSSRKEGRRLADLISGLREPAESAEVRLPVTCSDFAPYTQQILNYVTDYFSNKTGFTIVPNNYEGVRVNAGTDYGNGWFLIRRSLHDPLLPVNIESDDNCGVAIIAKELLQCLSCFDGIELAMLAALAK